MSERTPLVWLRYFPSKRASDWLTDCGGGQLPNSSHSIPQITRALYFYPHRRRRSYISFIVKVDIIYIIFHTAAAVVVVAIKHVFHAVLNSLLSPPSREWRRERLRHRWNCGAYSAINLHEYYILACATITKCIAVFMHWITGRAAVVSDRAGGVGREEMWLSQVDNNHFYILYYYILTVATSLCVPARPPSTARGALSFHTSESPHSVPVSDTPVTVENHAII